MAPLALDEARQRPQPFGEELGCRKYASALALKVRKQRQVTIRDQQIMLGKRTDMTVDTLTEQTAQLEIARVSWVYQRHGIHFVGLFGGDLSTHLPLPVLLPLLHQQARP